MALTLPDLDRLVPQDKNVYRLYGLLLVAWLLVLFFQFVGVDETEHLHVAWLMGARGLQPFNDFFQHHMPLLWELLKPYFLLGGSGPEVLYFGRGLVVLCAILTLWGFHVIAVLGSENRSSLMPPALGGTALFMVATLMMPEQFGIRPESVAIALFLWSHVFWIRSRREGLPQGLVDIACAGLLLGLVFLSSPRLLLPGVVFLLPTDDAHRAPFLDLKRLVLLAIGAFATVFGYLALSDTSLEELHFILSFSSLLQQVGEGEFPGRFQTASVVLAAISLFGIAVFVRYGKKSRFAYMWTDLAFLPPVILASILASGKYIYGQDLSPIIVTVALLLIRGQNRLEQVPQLRILFFGATIALWLLLLPTALSSRFLHTTIVDHVEKIRHELAAIPAGERVMLHSGLHPILVKDASFYGNPLWDSEDRICRAVRLAQADWPLPTCDFSADLENHRPYLVTTATWALGAGDRLARIKEYLDRHYARCGNFYVRLPDERTDSDGTSIHEGFSRCRFFGKQAP